MSNKLEMATAQRTRPRAVVGAPRRAAWQLKSALRHSISAAPRTIIFLHLFLQLLERPTLASRVPLFLLGHFLTNECEISDFC